MALPEEPYTRVEQYLARLAGQNVDIPDYPITRIECYLDYLVNNGGGATAPNAGAHNAIFRGQSLGNALTDAQVEAISSGTFDDIYIGDYWTMGTRTYRVAGLDHFYRFGDVALQKHHAVIVPDTNMVQSAVMNETATTEGGYAGSYMRSSILPGVLDTIKSLFGESHILTRRTRIVSTVTNGIPSASSWVDSQIEALTESLVIGRGAFGTQAANGYNVGEKVAQLPLFGLNPQYVHNRTHTWLQDVVNATQFAYISNYGLAYFAAANNTAIGIRPYFLIGDAS